MQGAHPSIEARVDDAVSMLIMILSGSYPLLPAIALYLRAVFSLALLNTFNQSLALLGGQPGTGDQVIYVII